MENPTIKRILVAEVGPCRKRIVNTAQERGLEVAVSIRACDAESDWPDESDYAVYISEQAGIPWPSPAGLVSAALDAGCDAIHPGGGVLARDLDLAQRVRLTGLVYVGPKEAQLQVVADRAQMRRLVQSLGIPVVPGSEALSEVGEAETWLAWAGMPAVVKSVDARGVSALVVENNAEALEAINRCLESGPIFLERLVERAREIEVPVIGDGDGDVFCMGEIDTTVRWSAGSSGGARVLAESPAPGLSDEVRAQLEQWAAGICGQMEWGGLCAVRFLVTPDGRAYFLQVRPGWQPWHRVTETVYGVDLIDAQMRLAGGEFLGWDADDLEANGHGICLRVVADDCAGVLESVRVPDGVDVLVGVDEGDAVAARDALISMVVRSSSRQSAIVKANAALDAVFVDGVKHNQGALKGILSHPGFWEAPLDRDEIRAIVEASSH